MVLGNHWELSVVRPILILSTDHRCERYVCRKNKTASSNTGGWLDFQMSRVVGRQSYVILKVIYHYTGSTLLAMRYELLRLRLPWTWTSTNIIWREERRCQSNSAFSGSLIIADPRNNHFETILIRIVSTYVDEVIFFAWINWRKRSKEITNDNNIKTALGLRSKTSKRVLFKLMRQEWTCFGRA